MNTFIASTIDTEIIESYDSDTLKNKIKKFLNEDPKRVIIDIKYTLSTYFDSLTYVVCKKYSCLVIYSKTN